MCMYVCICIYIYIKCMYAVDMRVYICATDPYYFRLHHGTLSIHIFPEQ